MVQTIVAVDPLTGRPGLIVEVRPDLEDVTPEDLKALERRLFQRRVRVGLLVTPRVTWIVRDKLTTLEFDSNDFDERQLRTVELLEHANVRVRKDRLSESVQLWLDCVAASWYSSILPAAAPLLVPDVVGQLVEANYQIWDGLLEPAND